MSLAAIYERFLASPNPISLSENASLHYIPTLTSHTQSGSIIRHLESQGKNVVTVKSFKTLTAIEGQNALAIEVDTTLEFISGGGAYLPGLENFVADKTASIPITHIVLFGPDQKITQIRMSWDQGSLLKQAEVIGSRGRNWPVVDGQAQIQLIKSSKSMAPAPTSNPTVTSPTSPRGRGTNENGFGARNQSPSKKHIKDPYASLDLFGPQKNDENRQIYSDTNIVAPRASAKPAPREMSELFAAGHEDLEEKPGSPKKSYATPAVAPKGAGSRNYGDVRVFEKEDSVPRSDPKIYKTNPARYNHFNLGEGDDHDDAFQHRGPPKAEPTQAIPMRARTGKGGSQWDFVDFVTPAKVPMKVRAQDKVNINFDEEGDQERSPGKTGKGRREAESHFEFKDDGTPVDRHAVPKPRKDAETHFGFNDEPTPAPRRIIARTDAAKGIYRDVVHEDLDDGTPLANISNNARSKDFGSHWDMTDDSPANTKNGYKGVSDNRKKAVNTMNSNWESYDQSPNPSKRPTSKGQTKAMETHWSMGDDEQQQSKPTAKAGGANRGGGKGFWDF